jgi:septum site-determining protein MinD
MVELCRNLKNEFDYVIIDCPAGIEQGFKNAIIGAEKAIVVTTPEVAAVRDADRVIGLLEAQGIEQPQLVINRIRADMVKHGDMMDIDDIIDILAVDLLGVVPEDELIVISTNRGEPAVLDVQSKAGEAYRNISRRIAGEDVPIMPLEVNEGIMSRLKKLIGMR